MKTICKAWVLAMAVSGIAVLGVAQTAKKPAFEVASIKSGESVGPTLQACICTTDAHQFTARKTTLYALIKTAYGIHSGPCEFWECDLLTGGPQWIKSERFEIQALIPEGSQAYIPAQLRDKRAPELQAMIRTLLEEVSSRLTSRDAAKVCICVESGQRWFQIESGRGR